MKSCVLPVLSVMVVFCFQTSCSCVNPDADAASLALMARAEGDLKPLESPESLKLTENQEEYLDFYGVKRVTGYRLGSFKSGEYSLAGHLISPEKNSKGKGTVVVVHGYFDHACCTVNLVNQLVHSGYHVAMYDHPGHGLSDGKRVSIDQFADYEQGFTDFWELVSREMPGPYDVVAHSMGSTVVIDHLDKHGSDDIRRMAFVAPLVKDTKPRVLHAVGSVIYPVVEYLVRPLDENSSDKDYRSFAVRDPLQFRCVSTRWAVAFNRWRKNFDASRPRPESPLIIFAGADTVVDNKFGRGWLEGVFPNQKSAMIEGGGHQLLNEDAEKKGRVLELIMTELER